MRRIEIAAIVRVASLFPYSASFLFVFNNMLISGIVTLAVAALIHDIGNGIGEGEL